MKVNIKQTSRTLRHPQLLYFAFLLAFSLFVGQWLTAVPLSHGQTESQFRITQIDASHFPEVRLTALTADNQSRPLPADAWQAATLEENGVAVTDLTIQVVPVGVDVTFVLDANADFGLADGSNSQTRWQTVQESLSRYANRIMSPAGIDQVSVIVPDGAGNGRYLVQNATLPSELLAALQTYTPETSRLAPVETLLHMAVDAAQASQPSARFQAVLLFTDAGEALEFPALITQAQTLSLPLFVAILGSQASSEEIAHAQTLTLPTHGTFAHMPRPEETDGIYFTWQAQGNQPQIRYRSRQTQSGSYPLLWRVGELQASAMLNLTITPPDIAVVLVPEEIERTGMAEDTPLDALTPTTQQVAVRVQWPDGLPRSLTAVALQVDGQSLPEPAVLSPDAEGLLYWTWPLPGRGFYTLQATASDELGYAVESLPVVVHIREERPSPPTATPTPPPLAVTPPRWPTVTPELRLLFTVVGCIALGVLLLRQVRRSPKPIPVTETVTAQPPQPSMDVATAVLVWADGAGQPQTYPLTPDGLTIGRDNTLAQLVLEDGSVARLHARIRWVNGRYWLSDEGSSSGTMLNFQRLGLSPQPLAPNDTIGIGRLTLRFKLLPPSEEQKSENL